MWGLRVVIGSVFTSLLLFSARANQPETAAGRQVTASDVKAVVEAIEDEIYANNYQVDGYNAGMPDEQGGYRLNLYVQPEFNEQGLAWTIYKLMPYGEVNRMFWIRKDGLAGLYVNPRTGYSPTQPSYLTVYMDDTDLLQCKRTWLKSDFVVELHPSAVRLRQAVLREKERLGGPSSAYSPGPTLKDSPDYQDSLRAARKAQTEENPTGGATHFLLDYGQPLPAWAEGVPPMKTFGPFLKTLGGGDGGKDVKVRILILP